MAKNKLERIAELNEEIAQIKRQQALLRQQHNKQERKDRAHRLCKRGGLVEKMLPGLALITDEQFEVFAQKTLLSGFAEQVLNGLLPPPEHGAEPENTTAEPAPQAVPAHPPKSAATAHGSVTTGNSEVADTARAVS